MMCKSQELEPKGLESASTPAKLAPRCTYIILSQIHNRMILHIQDFQVRQTRSLQRHLVLAQE